MTPLKMRTEKKMRRHWKPGHFTGSDDEAQGLGLNARTSPSSNAFLPSFILVVVELSS
jgi:hypothetical protein